MTSSVSRLITTHFLILLLCKMRYGLIRKLSITPHLVRVLAVRYFYYVCQREQSQKIMAKSTGWNVDKRALLPTRNILLAAI